MNKFPVGKVSVEEMTTKEQNHYTGELPASGKHDPECKWLCPVQVGTVCDREHRCNLCVKVVK